MPDLNDELMQELLSTFRYEAAEHLEAMNGALLQFERTDDPALRQQHIQTAFRAAHSLKGAARAVSQTELQTIAHAVETVFQRVRDEEAPLPPEQCDLLYDTLDAMGQLLGGDDVDTQAILVRLAAISPAQNGAPPPDAAGDGDDASAAHAEPDATPDETIRVSLRKLDGLMAEVGELLVSRISAAQRLTETRKINQLMLHWTKTWGELKLLLKGQEDQRLMDVMFAHADVMQDLLEHFSDLEQDTYRDVMRLDMVTNSLQDRVRQVRMIPFRTQALTLERVVRDAARTENKAVDFEIIGEDTELDKKILELLKDPLVHLLRNAVGHGIEPTEERTAAGKLPQGQVKVLVQQRGSEVHINIYDDGRGFDEERLRQAYSQRYGDIPQTEQVVNLAFMPGVSTNAGVTEISGRGIGLDIVRERLQNLHGRVLVDTEAGEGTTSTLVVPISLAITRTLLVTVGAETYAVPLLSVEKILVPQNVITISGKPLLRVEGHSLPLVSLAQLLERPNEREIQQQLALILAAGERQIAILVDDVITEQELAVKPLTAPIKHVRNVTGAALLGNGVPVIVLNPAELIRSYQGSGQVSVKMHNDTLEPQRPAVNVLVVDDSITTRTLERNILEAAGYNVITATDGVEALNRLQEHSVDVVVSDIEMPNMNGFELTAALRAHNDFAEMPVILVTSLERDEDRERGMHAGADAYIVKRGFDQAELLTIIDQFAHKEPVS